MKILYALVAAFVGSVLIARAHAGGDHGHHRHESVAGLPTSGVDATVGEITKIDLPAGRVFIKHGDMRNIGILAMLMVFDVKDPAMLERVRVGDKVAFTVQRDGQQLTVIKIDLVQ